MYNGILAATLLFADALLDEPAPLGERRAAGRDVDGLVAEAAVRLADLPADLQRRLAGFHPHLRRLVVFAAAALRQEEHVVVPFGPLIGFTQLGLSPFIDYSLAK